MMGQQSRLEILVMLLKLSPLFLRVFPGGSEGKASAYNDPGSVPGLGRSPGEGNGNPFQLFLPGKSHGQRSLVGYSPQGSKELDTTERLHYIQLTLRQHPRGGKVRVLG